MEAARSAMGLMNRLDSTVERLNGAVGRIDRELLNDRVLTNLATALANTRRISERAETAMARIDGLVASQEPVVRDTLLQVHDLTATLRQTATNLEATVDSVRPDLQSALHDAAGASADLKRLASGLESGQGVAGALLKDAALRNKVDAMVTDLGTLSSNLARFGILYHPKGPRPTNSTPYLSRPRWE
jgi:outer membrane murein-binding lipoprotein Lpp